MLQHGAVAEAKPMTANLDFSNCKLERIMSTLQDSDYNFRNKMWKMPGVVPDTQ